MGGSSSSQLKQPDPAPKKTGPLAPVQVPQPVIPNHNALLAQQLSKGGYGNQGALMAAMQANQQDPNQAHQWFYNILNDPEHLKKKTQQQPGNTEGQGEYKG